MRTRNKSFKSVTILIFLICALVFSQDQEQLNVNVTTMHWNMDLEDFSMKEWKATEKEYLDNVVMKNEHIAGASFFLHQFTEDNSEILYVQVFMDWNDIELASNKNGDLAKEAWPDEEARKARGKKWGKYFTGIHGDYVYSVIPELSK